MRTLIGMSRTLAVLLVLVGACDDDPAPTTDAGPDAPADMSAPGDGGPDVGDAGPGTDADAAGDGAWVRPPLPAPADHRQAPLYFSSDLGTFRISLNDRTPHPFGAHEPTTALIASPSGARVAQQLAAGRVEVYGRDGTKLSSFDVRPGLLGWADEQTLIFHDARGTGKLHRARFDGALRVDLPNPDPLPAVGIRATALSPERALAVVLMETVAIAPPDTPGELFLVRTSDGSIVRRLGRPADTGPWLMWTADDLIVSGARGSKTLFTLDPDSGQMTRTSLPFEPCGLQPWVPFGTVLIAGLVPYQDTFHCVKFARVTVQTGAAEDNDWVGRQSRIAGPVLAALSRDGRKVVTALPGSGLMIADAAGGEPEPLASVMGTISAIGWGAAPDPSQPPPGPPDPVEPGPDAGTPMPVPDPIPPPAARSGSSDCRQGRWVDRTPSPRPPSWPSARADFGAAFDPARGALLVHGGYPVSQAQATVEWEGARGNWVNHTRPDGFGPRFGLAMAHDSRRQQALAFGGMARINGEQLGDGPWRWSATDARWVSAGAAGPDGRSNPAAVYDAARDRLVMVGGSVRTDVWEWNPAANTWAAKTSQPPEPASPQIFGHRLVYDGKRGQVLMLGNRDLGPDLWVWNGDAWVRRPSTGSGPLPREWAQVAYDEVRDRVVLFGGLAIGQNISIRGDLWELDPATAQWKDCGSASPAPRGRIRGAMAHDSARRTLVLFGGETFDQDGALGDLWEWYVP